MPGGKHTIEIPVSIERVWNFISDVNHWAPLVPGYIEHEIQNDRRSVWSFKGDLGFMTRTVKLQIDIANWTEPEKVTFDLTGLSDNFSGNGYFEAEALDENLTRMSGCLDITAQGAMEPMINPVLISFVPKIAKELTEAIAGKIKENEQANR